MTIQNISQAVETLSGGQRQGVAVARAAAFGSKVVIMDEPTAALGVKESRRVLELILDVKRRGLPIVLISHNMPHVFEVADRIHIHRLGRRLCTINPKDFSMSDAVAFMTGAKEPPAELRGPPKGPRSMAGDAARRPPVIMAAVEEAGNRFPLGHRIVAGTLPSHRLCPPRTDKNGFGSAPFGLLYHLVAHGLELRPRIGRQRKGLDGHLSGSH